MYSLPVHFFLQLHLSHCLFSLLGINGLDFRDIYNCKSSGSFFFKSASFLSAFLVFLSLFSLTLCIFVKLWLLGSENLINHMSHIVVPAATG